jgi:hypothetical protein
VKTIDLATNPVTVNELLDSARHESVVVKSADGATFVVSGTSGTDEFTTEVELLRRNHRFLELLDTWKRDRRTLSLEEVEERLRARETG